MELRASRSRATDPALARRRRRAARCCAPAAARGAGPEAARLADRAAALPSAARRQVERIAERADKVAQARARRARSTRPPTRAASGAGRSASSATARRSSRSRSTTAPGAILEQWTGDQVAWRMARGYPGAFGRKLNAPYVWIPLCLLFLAAVRRPPPPVPAAPPRPARAARLRRLALLLQPRRDRRVGAARLSRCWSTCSCACCGRAAPARARRAGWCPHVPIAWLAVALVFLVGFRVALNVVDSNVIDVGYAGVIGADRIVDGDGLYGDGFSQGRRRRATPTGRSTTCSTSRSSRRCPGAVAGTTCPPRTGRRSPSTCSRSGRCCCSAGAAAGPRRDGARGRARLRLGGVPVHGVRARDELERHARRARLRVRAARRSRAARPRHRRGSSAWARRRSSRRSALAPLFARRRAARVRRSRSP